MDDKDVELEEKGVKMRIKQEKRKATPSMYAYSDELTQSKISETEIEFLEPNYITKLILRWIISAKHSFNIVENHQLIELVKERLNPDYKMPTEKEIEQIYRTEYSGQQSILFQD